METYTFLRELAMVIFYIIACLWSFRPGAQSANDEAAGIPFRNDGDAPAQSQELEAE